MQCPMLAKYFSAYIIQLWKKNLNKYFDKAAEQDTIEVK